MLDLIKKSWDIGHEGGGVVGGVFLTSLVGTVLSLIPTNCVPRHLDLLESERCCENFWGGSLGCGDVEDIVIRGVLFSVLIVVGLTVLAVVVVRSSRGSR